MFSVSRHSSVDEFACMQQDGVNHVWYTAVYTVIMWCNYSVLSSDIA